MKPCYAKLLACILMIPVFGLQAQENRTLVIETETKSDRSVDFNYNKTDPGTYTVIVNFSNLTNTVPRQQFHTAKHFSGKLFTLSPINKEQGIGYSYRYTYIRGQLKPRYQPDFLYLLPYSDGVKVRATESTFLRATYFGDTTPEDWKAYRFHTREQQTVTAARKGRVIDLIDIHEQSELSGVSYTSQVNELTIEHEDGTLAIYRGFQKGSFQVKLDETVFPGTPLGLNSKYEDRSEFNVSMMVFYLKSIELDGGSSSLSKSKNYYGYITPYFHTMESASTQLTNRQEYTAKADDGIRQKEMTRRELRQLK